MPLRNQTHPFLETHKRKTQTIAGPLCSPLSILLAHPSTICTITVLQRKFSCDFCQSVWALFSPLWTRGQKPGNIPPWPWLTPEVRTSQDNVRKSFFPLTATSAVTTLYPFHPDACSWRPAELVSVVREPLVYSRTPVPAPRIAEVTQVRLMDARSQFPGGKWIDADGCFARDENDGKGKREAGALTSHEQSIPYNLPPSSCCFQSVDQNQTLAATGEKRKESFFLSPFPFLLRFPSSLTGIGRNVARSCPWIVSAL